MGGRVRSRLLPGPARPTAMDAALAAAAAVLSLGAVVTGQVDEGPGVVTIPVALLLPACLLARTVAPLPALVVAVLAGTVQGAVAQSPGTIGALAVYLLLTFAVGAQADEASAIAGGVVAVGGLALQEALDPGTHYPDYLFVVLVFGGVWCAGRALRGWRGRAMSAEQHQRDLARLAVTDERVRIARELHDVVANALSVIAVQADAAEAALAHDPGLAGEPLRRIRQSSRTALSDMRQMLTVLRPEGPGPAGGDAGEALRPARGVADLPELVSTMRDGGLPLAASVLAPDVSLPPGVGLAVYRIAQEGLTNVLKHAGTVPTHLDVSLVDGCVEVRVHNETGPVPARPAGGSGHGLLGVRERVQTVGGRLDVGPDDRGGFLLRATLPVRA